MRDDIIAALAAQSEVVQFGGVAVHIRELDCAAEVPTDANVIDGSLKLLILCAHDAEGKRVFTDEDLPRLRGSARKRIKPLIDAVMRVNGFGIEAEAKNSAADPGSGGSTP